MRRKSEIGELKDHAAGNLTQFLDVRSKNQSPVELRHLPVTSGARALWSRIQQNAASGRQPKLLRPEFRVVGSSWHYPRPTENAGLHHSFLADDMAIE